MRGTHLAWLAVPSHGRIIPAHAGNTMSLTLMRLLMRDHPRACGEHRDGVLDSFSVGGSSPRMRGTLGSASPAVGRHGIIPAHAGNTLPCGLSFAGIGDHPRACGEHPGGFTADAYLEGSSPRMRGTPFGAVRSVSMTGIIPAHAGNTVPTEGRWIVVRDHPRACGEHLQEKATSHYGGGSSPRMRGTLSESKPHFAIDGIIPAHAGNTVTLSAMHAEYWDHPRACGEHMLTMFMCCRQPGSSPRMRGTPADDSDHCPPFRDHPRACGEHLMFEPAEHIGQGSSPRMRGTQSESHTRKLITGIIPAHAGNTYKTTARRQYPRDHPRACGEHLRLTATDHGGRGSSPRMRGTPPW